MEGPSIDIDDLADDLLAAQRGDDSEVEEPAPKPGSKKYLIGQIQKICEASGVPQAESTRELTRMSRNKLKELVAEYVAKAEKKQLADQLGAKSSCDAVLAVSMLRMAHDTAFKVIEPSVDSIAKSFTGLTIEGFTDNLREEPVSSQLNEVLRELVRENPDMLGWASNPWTRLAIIYAQCLAFTARKYKPDQLPNASAMGRPAYPPYGGRGDGDDDYGSSEDGQVLHVQPPSEAGGPTSV